MRLTRWKHTIAREIIMYRCLLFASIIPVLLAVPAFAQGQSGGASHGPLTGSQQLSQQDRQWLDYAATDNQGEIQESLVAEKKAHSPALKAFVRLMVDDHMQIESRLATLVNGHSVSVPNGPGQKNAKTMSEMEQLSGPQFDQRFLQEQIQDHSDDLRKFSEEIKATQDPDVRSFAAETLPILQQHLALAKAVDASLPASDERQIGNRQ